MQSESMTLRKLGHWPHELRTLEAELGQRPRANKAPDARSRSAAGQRRRTKASRAEIRCAFWVRHSEATLDWRQGRTKMQRSVVVVSIASLCLLGCKMPSSGTDAGAVSHGRYLGVGIYPAGQMWSQIVNAGAPKDPAAARANDDEQVIVVVDSNTGELRQCGNLTGRCVGMNPWARPLAPAQLAPVPLAKHADQLAQEAAAAAKGKGRTRAHK